MLEELKFEISRTLTKFKMMGGYKLKRFTVLSGHPFLVNDVTRHIATEYPSVVPYSTCLETEYHFTEYKDRVLGVPWRKQQAIVTTQSYEVLEIIVEVFKKDQIAQENFAYVRLDKVPNKEGHIEGVFYSYDLLAKAIKRNWEVR